MNKKQETGPTDKSPREWTVLEAFDGQGADDLFLYKMRGPEMDDSDINIKLIEHSAYDKLQSRLERVETLLKLFSFADKVGVIKNYFAEVERE